jgi:hypothetical protein
MRVRLDFRREAVGEGDGRGAIEAHTFCNEGTSMNTMEQRRRLFNWLVTMDSVDFESIRRKVILNRADWAEIVIDHSAGEQLQNYVKEMDAALPERGIVDGERESRFMDAVYERIDKAADDEPGYLDERYVRKEY